MTITDTAGAEDFCRTPVWFKNLENYTFPTSFVELQPSEIKSLSKGELEGIVPSAVIKRLETPMRGIPWNHFISVDMAAPTDTERFIDKDGAVHSAESAWDILASSKKIQLAASTGKVSNICIRPFRRINRTHEFRLFIYEGKLAGMSQYWLVRHFRRLEGVKQRYWERAQSFIKEVQPLIPVKNIVMDVYFTSDGKILIIDFNKWGSPTLPLLFKKWERDWTSSPGIRLITPLSNGREKIRASL